jgi:hypothetical protein
MYGRAGDFLVGDGRLLVRVPTERDLPLFASSDSTFYALRWGGVHFTFHRDTSGRATSVEVSDGHGSRRAPRASP